jgi:hypothetical protein
MRVPLCIALSSLFVVTWASVTPKTPDNPCGVRGTYNADTKTCTCKEGWDPKYNCDFGFNPLGDVPWQQQFQALADPKNFKAPSKPFDISKIENASFAAFDPANPPSFEALAAHDVGGSWSKFKSDMHYCGPCDLKNAGHCKSGAGALMIALGTYQGVFKTYGTDWKDDPWLIAMMIATGLYGSTGDLGDHKNTCGDVQKFSGMMNQYFGSTGEGKAHGGLSWDDYWTVKDPLPKSEDFIGYNDKRAPGRSIAYGVAAPYGNGIWTYDYWGKAAPSRKLSGWENLAYLFQVQLNDALGVVGEDDPLFMPSEAPLDRWWFAMNITKEQFFSVGANGRDGTPASSHTGGTHAGYWHHDQWHYLRVQIRAAWEKNGAIHPPVLPLLFYTKTMAGSDKYPIHDIYDPKALVQDKMPQGLGLDWKYEGKTVLELAYQNDDEAYAIFERAGWHPGMITLITTIAMSGFFHQEHPKYAYGCTPDPNNPIKCIMKDPDQPCMDYCIQDNPKCKTKYPTADFCADCKPTCNDDSKWDPDQVLEYIGYNKRDDTPVSWDIMDRMGAINDCFFAWQHQGKQIKDKIWQMWDQGAGGNGLKQYFERNRWLDRLKWLNNQLKHQQVTQAPVATPEMVLYTACGNVCTDDNKKKLAATDHQYVDIPWVSFKEEGSDKSTTVAGKCNSIKVCYKAWKATPELVNGDSPSVDKSKIGQVVTKYHMYVGVADSHGACNPSHELWNDPASVHIPTCYSGGGVSVWVGEPINPTAAPTYTPLAPGATGVPTTQSPTTNAPTMACTAGAPKDSQCAKFPEASKCDLKNPWFSTNSKVCHTSSYVNGKDDKSGYICCAPPPAPKTRAPTSTPAPTPGKTTPTPKNGTSPTASPTKNGSPTSAPQLPDRLMQVEVKALAKTKYDSKTFLNDLASNTSEPEDCFKIIKTTASSDSHTLEMELVGNKCHGSVEALEKTIEQMQDKPLAGGRYEIVSAWAPTSAPTVGGASSISGLGSLLTACVLWVFM